MYQIYEEEIEVEPGQSYFTYGIELSDAPWRVGQISVVRAEVEQLARQMNENEVSPLHMWDVAEDWLATK